MLYLFISIYMYVFPEQFYFKVEFYQETRTCYEQYCRRDIVRILIIMDLGDGINYFPDIEEDAMTGGFTAEDLQADDDTLTALQTGMVNIRTTS